MTPSSQLEPSPSGDSGVEPASGVSVEALMLGCVRGNKQLFTPLYKRLAPKLYAYAFRRTQQHDIAEDVVQSTLTKLYRSRHLYRPGTPLLPWALTIAKNTLYDEGRMQSRRHESTTFDGELPIAVSGGHFEYLEVLETVEEALSELSIEQRQAIELTRLQGLSGEEAARQLGISQGAVKLRVHRALGSLRTALANAWSAGSQSLALSEPTRVTFSPA